MPIFKLTTAIEPAVKAAKLKWRGRVSGLIATDGELYWAGEAGVARFGDETRPEDPYLFARPAACRTRCEKQARDLKHRGNAWYPAIWVHPEADYKVLESYVLMTGHRLSGSPTQ
jgi:hypothetical protein